MFEIITDVLHHELTTLEDKYDTGAPMSAQDLENIDRMAHALKCFATYEAMRGENEKRRPSRYYGRY